MAANADRLALVHALARGALPIYKLTTGGEGTPVPRRCFRLDAFPRPAIVCAARHGAEIIRQHAVARRRCSIRLR